MSLGFHLSFLYFLAVAVGAAGDIEISAAQTDVIGYENDSILLSVSYHLHKQSNWLQIRWQFLNQPNKGNLGICTITVDDSGNKIIRQFPADGYERRMRVIPENGSLIIQHLKMEDSGIYRVSLLDNNLNKSIDIKLNVTYRQTDELQYTEGKNPLTGGQCNCSCSSSGVDVPTSAWIVFSSRLSSIFIAILIFLILHIRDRRFQR